MIWYYFLEYGQVFKILVFGEWWKKGIVIQKPNLVMQGGECNADILYNRHHLFLHPLRSRDDLCQPVDLDDGTRNCWIDWDILFHCTYRFWRATGNAPQKHGERLTVLSKWPISRSCLAAFWYWSRWNGMSKTNDWLVAFRGMCLKCELYTRQKNYALTSEWIFLIKL